MEKIFLDNASVTIDIEDLVSMCKAGAKRYGWFIDYLYKVFEVNFPKGKEYIDLSAYEICEPNKAILGVAINGKCVILNLENNLEVVWLNSLNIETFVSIIEKFIEMRGPK